MVKKFVCLRDGGGGVRERELVGGVMSWGDVRGRKST